MSLIRWEPFREMDDFFRRYAGLGNRLPRSENGDWTPTANITETDKEYLIKAELPEVKKEDVKITVQEGVLVITGERKIEKEEKGKRYHRLERAYGSFARSFTLPDDSDGSKVNAEFKDGVLKVHLAKSEKAKPKQIEVKVT